MRLCGVYFPYNSEGKGIKKGILKSYMLAMVFSEFDFKHKNIHPETIYTYFVSEWSGQSAFERKHKLSSI